MAVNPANDEPEWVRLARQLAADIRKRRQAAGLSQPRLAVRIGYTPAYVSMAERPGKGLPSAALVQAIDNALGAEGALVALRDQADAARKACRPGAESSTVEDEASPTGGGPGQPPDPEEVEQAKRRELITSAAAIAFGGSLDEPVRRILAAADEPQVPARVGAGDVAHLRSAVETVRARGRYAGGGAVRHQAVAALRWATTMQKSSCIPEVRRELASTIADLAGLASCFTRDAGRHEPARQLSLLGLQAEHESGDLGMRAWVAGDLARQEICVGNWAGGLDLIQLAFTARDALTPNGIADLHIVKARAYARKQDIAGCRRCVGTATDTYRPDSVSNDPPWLSYLTPTQLQGDLANVRYDLLLGGADVGDCGAERAALIEAFSATFHQFPADRARFKAIVATKLATLLYLEGEWRMAQQMAEDALVLAGQVRSARLADDLRVLLRTLPPADRADEHTPELRPRIVAVLAEMT